MPASDREYMKEVDGEHDVFLEGVSAKSQSAADKILKWHCSTRDAFGKWHPVTLALSNVTVSALYNILSNANFIAQQLREFSKDIEAGGCADPEELRRQADRVDSLRYLIYEQDRLDKDWRAMFEGVNIHRPIKTSTEKQNGEK